jgi:cellulase (glycosyl hydrolase family 5)
VRTLRSLLVAAFVLAAIPSTALASSTQESMFQDDIMLVYGTDAQVNSTLDSLAAFGVDRLRVSVFWNLVAPANDIAAKPAFDATDPAAYPQNLWAPYDRIVQAAAAHGIALNFNLTSQPVPRWAAGTPPADRADLQDTYEPDPVEFGKFVHAVGTRYSGTYNGLPRVAYWSIWNEPNQAGWLTPQWRPDPRNDKLFVEAAPAIYRNLVAAAWTALADTGHGADTVLIGETAPQGARDVGVSRPLSPLRFLRRLYCVDDNLNLLKGEEATVRGCPADAAAFVAANPALFHATGYAHHPYALLSAPGLKSRSPDDVAMADLPALSRELKRIYARYGQKTQSTHGVPLYLTEYGYQTKPDPYTVTFSQQAAFINQAEYIAYKNPNVQAMSQFLLIDDAPVAGVDPKKDPQLYWRTFQSGLKLLSGKRKPGYAAYLTPIYVTHRSVRRGRTTGVFGLLRGAKAGVAATAQVQFRAKGRKKWRTLRTVKSRGERNYLMTKVRPPGSGSLRLRWRNGANTLASRAAPVTVTR